VREVYAHLIFVAGYLALGLTDWALIGGPAVFLNYCWLGMSDWLDYRSPGGHDKPARTYVSHSGNALNGLGWPALMAPSRFFQKPLLAE